MIVGSFFDGDDDEQVAWKQHDVYGNALQIIVGTCNRLTWFARGYCTTRNTRIGERR